MADKRKLEDVEKEITVNVDDNNDDDEDEKTEPIEETQGSFSLSEVKGDLFSCKQSLAHCISADIAMGKGIAKIFKQKFGGVAELKNQARGVGECALLKRESRFVFYLITKPRYFNKPSYVSLKSSLESMRKLMIENNVTSLAIPKIGCGLDGLQWGRVKMIIEEVFKETVTGSGALSIDITVYYL